MKHEIHDSKLFLTAENEGDQALLIEIWAHPLITEITLPHWKFGKRDFRAELVCSAPARKIVESVPVGEVEGR